MKIIISGKKISATKVDVLSDNKVIHSGVMDYSDCEFDIPVINNIDLRFHFSYFDKSNNLDEINPDIETLNEDIIMTELQYPYDTQIRITSNMEVLSLSPERPKELEDFIVFVPNDMDLDVSYVRNESEDRIKAVVNKYVKKFGKIIGLIYLCCIAVSIALFYIGNTTASYMITRFLGFAWFALIVFPPMAFFKFSRDFIKTKKFLLKNLSLPSGWRNKENLASFDLWKDE